MIRYSLLCGQDHPFESWFRDSHAFDSLSAAYQVSCPACGSTKVRKAMMAPSVVTSRTKAKRPDVAETQAPVGPAASPPPSPPPVQAGPFAVTDERALQLRALVRELHARMRQNADDVGPAFASEARAIHEGDAPPRSIYGEATRDEIAGLVDDEIPFLPVPTLPDDHH